MQTNIHRHMQWSYSRTNSAKIFSGDENQTLVAQTTGPYDNKGKEIKIFKQVFFSFYTFYSENFHMIVVSTCIPFVISAIDNLFIIFWGFGVISSHQNVSFAHVSIEVSFCYSFGGAVHIGSALILSVTVCNIFLCVSVVFDTSHEQKFLILKQKNLSFLSWSLVLVLRNLF